MERVQTEHTKVQTERDFATKLMKELHEKNNSLE
jgi:hypothetical protein